MKPQRLLLAVLIQAILVLATAFISQSSFASNPALSGVYSFENEESIGSISIIFNEKGELWFHAIVRRDGGFLGDFKPANNEWIKVKDNKFTYSEKTSLWDYTMTGEFTSEEELIITDDFHGGISKFGMDLGLEGYYRHDGATFADARGFMYNYVDEASRVVLAKGGRYFGVIEVPASVRKDGYDYPVAGIGDDAFGQNHDVTEVRMASKDQYIVPGAFYNSGIPYEWDNLVKPGYIYPDPTFFDFASPNPRDEEFDYEMDHWAIFKQNCAHLTYVSENTKDEAAKWGCFYDNPAITRGVHYELRILDAIRKQMFRGYENFEVIALAVGSKFAAMHDFPPFSRWKYPEPEVSMSEGFEEEMARKYGRKVMYSRQIANLRYDNRRLAMVEFEHVDNEAMVAFAWIDHGSITATCPITRKIQPGYEEDIWFQGMETYGVPEVISIAMDPHGDPIIWINRSAPESKNIFGLRRVGDKLEIFGEDQWYVAYD